jgi:hypothetical protein
VQAEGDGVEVALEDDAGGVDELLVLGGVGDGFGVEVGGEADEADVGVDDTVRLRQEACGAGGGELVGVEGQTREDEEEEGGEEEGAGAGGDLGLLEADCLDVPLALKVRRGKSNRGSPAGMTNEKNKGQRARTLTNSNYRDYSGAGGALPGGWRCGKV